MWFWIKKQWFFQETFVFGEKNLFFVMCSSLSFEARSIFLLILIVNYSGYFSPCKYYSWKNKGILSGILDAYSEIWFPTIFLFFYFYYCKKQKRLFITFCCKNPSLSWFPWEILTVMAFLKQEISLLEERKCFCKNNRKELQNSVHPLSTHFFLRKNSIFWGVNADVFYITENPTTKTVH